MLEVFKRNPGAIALVLFAVGVAGTVLDPNGAIGITLFGVAAAAAVFLSARPFRNAIRRLAAIRPKSVPRRAVVRVVRGRTVALVASVMAALFAIWLTVDMSRPLVYACWWGFCLLGAWVIGVGALTARRSLRPTA
jgi:hypothetical protein